ncbi:hypothetical protein CYMTET_47001 [Cymbomonas tetramitiformis]|uniref:Uncharacterized protein n=1 Tax=Cymbomonas tetramitiformis TaxID=36881 RepID=A0AAE0BV15_9CHLO|nr:hypothetical protein CYMTET_47001 [Cymbomonas tetramitiformis]
MKRQTAGSGIFSKVNLGNDRESAVNFAVAEEFRDLSDFEQLETIGSGTFARVKLVRHKKTNAFYALKILKKNEAIRLKQVEHVLCEKQILSQVDHPYIVKLHSTYKDTRNLYFLTEYVPGGELFTHLRKATKFSNETARFYAGSIVLAIQYLHARDIIFRDLKPENLLLDSRGYLKFTDFGFSKKVPESTWTLCGTPEYLAPEIIQSKGHGKGVDWWALGVLIFEMIAGFPPFYDENPFGIYQKILANKLEFPRNFDVHAKDLVKKLLSADRMKRLGNLKGGAEDIKKHRWFKGFDFSELIAYKAVAPILPEVRSDGDAHNYEKYSESVDDPTGPVIDPATSEKLFRDF